MPRPDRRAFTLVELLVVITVLAILMGMALPMLGLASRAAKRANTQVTLAKVESAVRLFRREVGAFPWYADPWAGGEATNALGHRLVRDLTPTERDALNAALQSAEARYAMAATSSTTPTFPGAYAWLWSTAAITARFDNAGYYRSGESGMPYLQALTKMGIERARINLVAGNWDYCAPRLVGGVWVDGDASSRVINPSLFATAPERRGLCIDYLSADLPPSVWRDPALRGEMLDAWRRPLAYIAPITAGVSGWLPAGSSSGSIIYPPFYALDERSARRPVTTMTGHRAQTAAPAHVLDFELWSGGYDERLVAERADASVRDDVGLLPYHAGLR